MDIALAALIIDAIWGDPPWLYRRLPHPVVIMGKAIASLDALWNQPTRSSQGRRHCGIAATLIVIGCSMLLSGGLAWLVTMIPQGQWFLAIAASTLLAQHGLLQSVTQISHILREADQDIRLTHARHALRCLVGRDTKNLDEAAIGRASLESLAENLSDAVIAPLLAYLCFGLVGMAAYKAINTTDSMIGYRHEPYRDFGWFAARLDDLVNWPAARITGALLLLAAVLVPGASPIRALRAWRYDSPRHSSPNAGHPEAVLAGALGIALAGPRVYAGKREEGAWMGSGGRQSINPKDIMAGIRLAIVALALIWIGLIVTLEPWSW